MIRGIKMVLYIVVKDNKMRNRFKYSVMKSWSDEELEAIMNVPSWDPIIFTKSLTAAVKMCRDLNKKEVLEKKK